MVLRGYFQICAQESVLLEVLRGSYAVLGIKPGLAAYKANTLPTVLFLSPKKDDLANDQHPYLIKKSFRTTTIIKKILKVSKETSQMTFNTQSPVLSDFMSATLGSGRDHLQTRRTKALTSLQSNLQT